MLNYDICNTFEIHIYKIEFGCDMGIIAKNEKRGELKHSALIQEESLKEFIKFLKANFSHISLAAKTSDGTEIDFTNIEELFQYPNYTKRKLINIKIESKGDKGRLDVRFDNNYEYRIIKPEVISYYLYYSETSWGFAFEDDLVEQLKEFKPWYNYFTYFNYTMGIPCICIAGILLFFGVNFSLQSLGFSGFINNVSSSTTNPQRTIEVFFIACTFVLLSYFINKIRNYFFPTLFIALGKQRKEYQKRQKILHFIFGVCALGILINIITSFILD